MTTIDVTIAHTPTGLQSLFPRYRIGTVTDDNAYTLSFTRPAEYDAMDMTLIFVDDVHGQLPAVPLGRGNIWRLTDRYTLSHNMSLRIVFTAPDYTESTRPVALTLTDIPAQPVTPDTPLWPYAFVNVASEGGYLIFRNMDGQEVGRIVGAGGGGHTILDADGNPMPPRVALQFTGVTVSDTEGATVVEGVSGEDGQDGATYTPAVDEGVISWTNDKGLPNPDPVDITGPEGPMGAVGADGYTPQRGVDYWTAEDQAAIVAATKDAIDLSAYATIEYVDDAIGNIDAALIAIVGGAG